jgi:hypothetical protein
VKKGVKLYPLSRNRTTNVRSSPEIDNTGLFDFVDNILVKVEYPQSLGIYTGISFVKEGYEWFRIQTRQNGIGWVREDVQTTQQPPRLSTPDKVDNYLTELSKVDFKNFHLLKTIEGFTLKLEEKGVSASRYLNVVTLLNERYEERQTFIQSLNKTGAFSVFSQATQAVNKAFNDAWAWLQSNLNGLDGLGYIWLVRLAPLLIKGAMLIVSTIALDRLLDFFEGGKALEKAKADEKQLNQMYNEVSSILGRELDESEKEGLDNVLNDTYKDGFKSGRSSANMFKSLTNMGIALGVGYGLFQVSKMVKQ